MIQVMYVEDEVADHPQTLRAKALFPRAQVVRCGRYGEVFNQPAQNFRLQKRQPALIVARKHDHQVSSAPAGYGIGGRRNFYFSHLLNCPYDCRYCFLQGMYRSAHWVWFVNYEDFETAIDRELAADPGEAWFFSGYDCDSLALEPVTGFVGAFLPFFERRPRAWLELRTKSVQVRALLARSPIANVVVAMSLSPREVADALEHGAPSLERRLRALEEVQASGWQVGLRFDPLVHFDGWDAAYERLFSTVFARIDRARLHSVSLGAFRLPASFHRRLVQLYPDEPMLAAPFAEQQGMVSYRPDLGRELFDRCERRLLEHVSRERYFPCSGEVAAVVA